MDKVHLRVLATPKPKQRPRMAPNGNVYTPRETTEYEKLIAWSYRAKSKLLFRGGVTLEIEFGFAPAKSTKRELAENMISGAVLYTKRPDLDNLVKAVKDALNGIAWIDDCQVVSMVAKKKYAKEEYIDIKIYDEILIGYAP